MRGGRGDGMNLPSNTIRHACGRPPPVDHLAASLGGIGLSRRLRPFLGREVLTEAEEDVLLRLTSHPRLLSTSVARGVGVRVHREGAEHVRRLA